MIYLTGDVHSSSMGGWEQKKIGSELDASEEYISILKKFKIKCTLFINGECIDREPEKIKKLICPEVEIGGHTYNNFGRLGIVKSYIYRKTFGCIYGSSLYQKRDIGRTKKAFEKINIKMNSWRTHAFGSNEKTFELLANEGVWVVSDLLGDSQPFKRGGIIHLPINIPVDNNTFAYGVLCPENRDPFASCTKGRITKDEWFVILKNRIIDNEINGKDSVLLIHPATMKSLDNFRLFKKIVEFLSRYKTGRASDIKTNFR